MNSDEHFNNIFNSLEILKEIIKKDASLANMLSDMIIKSHTQTEE